MKIRVCPRPEGFRWDDATGLPMGAGSEHLRWSNYEREDAGQQFLARQARQPQRDLVPDEVPLAPPVGPEHTDPSPQADLSAGSSDMYDGSVYSDSEYASSCSTISTWVSGVSDVDPQLVRLFADPEESPELQPLCHLWTDVVANIKQDEIPSPVHLFEERDAIVR